MRLFALLLLAAFAFAEDAPAKLDRLQLANGRTLIGTVESETADAYSVRLVGGQGGVMSIRKDRVTSIVRGVEDAPAPVAYVAPEDRPHPVESPERAARREEQEAAAAATAAAAAHIKKMQADAKRKGATVTAEMAQTVQERMPIADVTRLIGVPGAVRNNGDATVYEWKNANGSGLRVAFERQTQLVFGSTRFGGVDLP
jgi:hypothetical protein